MQDTYIGDEGKGFPLVLVHGFLGSSKMWKPQIDFFKDHFRIITPDLPGFGKSKKAKSHNSIQSIANLLLDCLEEKKIDTVFGIIGSANAYIFDSIAKKGYTKIVYTHHEQAAVMSAGAYYRASGKLSIAIVTAGGGASNAITGVLSNWADSIPCIILAGQESSFYVKNQKHLRMIGTQGFNASGMVNSIVKKSKCILKKNDVIKSLEEAYYYCLEGSSTLFVG